VAYNSAKVLPRHLDALLNQTRPLDEVVVVDNASADGTIEVVREHYPQVTLLRMAENLGSGGAWAAGLAYSALKARHNWTWGFDDDSVPCSDALELLVGGLSSLGEIANGVGITACMAVHAGTGATYPPLFWEDGFVRPSASQMLGPVLFPDLVIASGCMVRRDVVEKIGLPRSDFFMDFVDFEFCLRARDAGYRVAVFTNSRIRHEIGSARPVRLLMAPRVWSSHAPWREYYMSRNLVFSVWHLRPTWRAKAFCVRHLLRHAAGVVLFSSRRLTCLARMAQGFRDGKRGQLGVRFLPGC